MEDSWRLEDFSVGAIILYSHLLALPVVFSPILSHVLVTGALCGAS